MCVITKRSHRNDYQLHPNSNSLVFMTSFRLEKRQNQPDLQEIMTTAIIEVQKEKLLT